MLHLELKQIFTQKYENFLITVLRWTLGLIFVWFGALKIFGYNPVYDLVYNSIMPLFAGGSGLIFLGVLEVLIGLLLLSNRTIIITHSVLFLHLLGTFSTFLFGWHVVFDPYFPILTLDGEFVVKNMALAASGLVVMAREARRNASS